MTEPLLFTRPERSCKLINFLKKELESKKRKAEDWKMDLFIHSFEGRDVKELKFFRFGNPFISCVILEDRPNVITTNNVLAYSVIVDLLGDFSEPVLIEIIE